MIGPAPALRRLATLLLAGALVLSSVATVAVVDVRAASAAASSASNPTSPPQPAAAPTPTPTLSVALRQISTAYDATANRAQVKATATPTGYVAPWQYSFAVRGAVVASGVGSGTAISVTLVNSCSITTQSVTVSVTDAAGRTATAASTLDRALCPPPPNVPHAVDRIIAGPTLTESSFVDRLRAVSSPALAEGRAIYQTLIAAHINPAFALGTFQAESGSGTRGYAVTTHNWGNILYYSWEAAFGATKYAPGNGYTYARYPTWLASVRAYAQLLTWYNEGGYITVSSASAHWLGTVEGSARHLTYLRNITAVMSILPDDAVPVMTALAVPAASRASVVASWTAKDNLGVTGYQLRTRRGTGAWSAPVATTATRRTVVLTSGTWTIGVRATDAAGNWSKWRYATVAVDANGPAMTALASSQWLVRSYSPVVTLTWNARDNVRVTGYQWRTRQGIGGAPSSAVSTAGRSRDFKLTAGTWYIAVRARDAVGNWSLWREVRVIVPVDDRRFTFSSGTTRLTGPAYFGGTLTTTSRSGARLSATFTGVGFDLIGNSGPSYGRMRVTIDGASYVVDAGYYNGKRATTTRTRTILFAKALRSGTHTVTITNLATRGRPTIAIDGLAFVR